MPVTTHPAPNVAYSAFLGGKYRHKEPKFPQTPRDMLEGCANHGLVRSVDEIFQSTFDKELAKATGEKKNESLYALDQGFVRAAIDAYNHHNHLIIRPDDVWHAILMQFNLFVNANAEEVRKLFVEHEGKRKLVVRAVGNRYTVDFGAMTKTMGQLIQANVVDEELREWFLPDFSTTEDNDRVVASVLLMATLKEFFSYGFELCCGLPQVTLLGEKSDWEHLAEKVERLPRYGKLCADWCELLRPVVHRFIMTFDAPDSDEVKDFWQRVAHHHSGGSGPRYFSGWITAFCFFDQRGQSLYHSKEGEKPTEKEVAQLTWKSDERAVLKLDGVLYHKINTNHIPPSCADVPVELDDNGRKFNCMMVAGVAGVRLSDSGRANPEERKMVMEEMYVGSKVDEHGNHRPEYKKVEVERTVRMAHNGKKDVVQPVAGWFMFSVKEVAKMTPEEQLMNSLSRGH